MGMAKFAPDKPMSSFDHYKARLQEIGRLAAVLDSSDDHPLNVILRFFEIDDADKRIVMAAYDAEGGGDD